MQVWPQNMHNIGYRLVLHYHVTRYNNNVSLPFQGSAVKYLKAITKN